jgi:hypothetical protein
MKKIYPSAVESGATTPRVPAANESTPLHLNDKGTQVFTNFLLGVLK